MKFQRPEAHFRWFWSSLLGACAVGVPQCRGGIPGAAGWDRNIDKVSFLAFLLDLKSCLN